jgi:hypothetical protein
MRYNIENYNRLTADRMLEWQENEWLVDKHGMLKMRDDDESIETISPLYER